MFETRVDMEFAETVINCLPELTRKKEQKFILEKTAGECLNKMEEMQKEGYTYKSFIPFGNDISRCTILVFEK